MNATTTDPDTDPDTGKPTLTWTFDHSLWNPDETRDAGIARPDAKLLMRARELFARLRSLARGRTAIYISHRFSTVRQADRILFLEHAELVEEGTHDKLMALGGRYRTMFELQASRFTEYDELGEEVVVESLD